MEKEMLVVIKPECKKCHFWTEVFEGNKLTEKCSKQKCEYEEIVKKILEFLGKN